MSKFKPARFGNAAVNTVTGELKIEGAMVIDSITVTDDASIPIDVSMVLVDNQAAAPITLTLPDIADVDEGHIISFKDSVGNFGSDQVIVEGDVLVDGGVPMVTTGMRLRINWQAATICSNGTIWNIIRYFDGSI